MVQREYRFRALRLVLMPADQNQDSVGDLSQRHNGHQYGQHQVWLVLQSYFQSRLKRDYIGLYHYQSLLQNQGLNIRRCEKSSHQLLLGHSHWG